MTRYQLLLNTYNTYKSFSARIIHCFRFDERAIYVLMSIRENRFGHFCRLPSSTRPVDRRIIRERKHSGRPRLTAEQDATTVT